MSQGLPVTARLAREATTAAYRLRAQEAAAQAEASSLDRVREKHEIAATRWRPLAELNEAGGSSRIAPEPVTGRMAATPITARTPYA
jgi:hypothetical protein